MESMEFNKIAGAVLGALLFAVGLNLLAEGIFTVGKPAKPGYIVAVAEAKGTATEAKAPVAAEPIAVRLKTASAADGEKVFAKCKACHNAEDPAAGGKDGQGPNLWGVVEGPAAHRAGFSYSSGLQDRAKANVAWTYDELDKFLTNPKALVKETKMGFAGLTSGEDRAAVILYLRSKAATPAPLPN